MATMNEITKPVPFSVMDEIATPYEAEVILMDEHWKHATLKERREFVHDLPNMRSQIVGLSEDEARDFLAEEYRAEMRVVKRDKVWISYGTPMPFHGVAVHVDKGVVVLAL